MAGEPGVSLRDLQPEDWQAVRCWEEDEEILKYLGGPGLTIEAPESYKGRRKLLAIDEGAKGLIGYALLREINWRQRTAEMRICIGEKSLWGRGYGTAAVRDILRLSFLEMNLEYIYLKVFSFNRRAIRCYEKCSFRLEGVLPAGGRNQQEIVLMGITRDEALAHHFGAAS